MIINTWHKEKFNLQIIIPSSDNNSNGMQSPIYFHGTVKYGDNIDDEWYITFLLLEISKKFINTNICNSLAICNINVFDRFRIK